MREICLRKFQFFGVQILRWCLVCAFASFQPNLSTAAHLLPQSIYPSSEEELLWEKIEVTPYEIEHRIKSADNLTYPCAKNENSFSRCVNMLLAIASYSTAPYRLIEPDEQIDLTVEVLSFGSIHLTADASYLVATPTIHQLSDRRQALLRIFQESKFPGNDLYEFWKWVRVNVLELPSNQARRNAMIIAGLNAWYQTFDPYARFTPQPIVKSYNPGLSRNSRIRSLDAKFIADDQLEPNNSGDASGESFVPMGKVAYIRIKDFRDIVGPMRDEIRRLQANALSALIIDLRGNSGSYLVDMHLTLDNFVDNPTNEYRDYTQTLFYTKPKNASSATQEYRHYSMRPDILKGKPIVVITDSATASSAEIFAGSLQAIGRAWILGNHTFGKGTRIESTPVFNGLAFLSHTSYLMYSPDGTTPHLWGITPHFLVESSRQIRIMNVYENLSFTDTPPTIYMESQKSQEINACRKKLKEAPNFEAIYANQIALYDRKIAESYLVLQCVLAFPDINGKLRLKN